MMVLGGSWSKGEFKEGTRASIHSLDGISGLPILPLQLSLNFGPKGDV